jgi:hypothetical protein
MRFRFKPSPEQRRTIRLQQARLSQAELLLAIVRSSLPTGFEPKSATGTIQSVHPDRFVMRVQVGANGAGERAFAVKVYSDDFGKHVWTLARTLAETAGPHHENLCLPIQYVASERALVFPWVDGEFLSDVVDERKPDLLRQAARLAANLHRLPVVPDAPSMPQMLLDDALARCVLAHQLAGGGARRRAAARAAARGLRPARSVRAGARPRRHVGGTIPLDRRRARAARSGHVRVHRPGL